MWKHAFGMASFQCLAKKDCSKVLWNTWFNLCEAVHHQKYWEWIFVILSATRLPTCPRNMWPLFKLLVTSSVLIVEDNLNLSSNLSKGKSSFKPYQNEYDSLIRYLTKCVAPGNIQTPTTEGISLRTPTSLDFPFLMGTDTPPPLRNFHKYDKDPPTPLEKFIFTKKDYYRRRMRPFMASTQRFPSEACILLFPFIWVISQHWNILHHHKVTKSAIFAHPLLYIVKIKLISRLYLWIYLNQGKVTICYSSSWA